jgi:hypothetical protein
MGKATNTGNLAAPPSPGAVALMEALAGFGSAPEASFTTADTITKHARERTGPPSKTVAQVLGEIAWLIRTRALRSLANDLMAPFASCIWQLCFRISFALLLVAGPAVAEVKPGLAEIERARALVERGDCARAWNILWPLAKNGDQEARYFLYSAVTGRMIPPAVTKDHTTWYRHVLVLTAYAAITPQEQMPSTVGAGHRFARIDVPASINALKLGADGERVAQCYANGPSFKICLDLAISLGVIPSFEEYALKTEMAERETGIEAHCLSRY